MKIKLTPNREIGDGCPVFIIAEVGNNHNGNFELACKSVELAAECHADAVTFQYAPIHTYCISSLYQDPQVAFLKQCEFSLEQVAKLGSLARKHGLCFSVNVEDNETLDQMLAIGIDFIKLCSADLTNIPYIQYAAARGKPIFFSTGGAYLGEIETAYHAMKQAGLRDYVIYHTNSGYPTPLEDANIVQMDLLHTIFGGIKGYCDHTVDIIPPVVATSRGAAVIEKHITTSRALKGDDWMVSLEPHEFTQMVQLIRQAEKCLGVAEKKPMAVEAKTRTFKRKSIVSRRPIRAGTAISNDDLCYKVPGTGLSPVDVGQIVGLVAVRDIPGDVLIEWTMVKR